MIEGQIVFAAAILAFETIPQEDIEAGESRVARRLHIGFERNDRRQLHFKAGRMHATLVLRQDVHALKEHRLDRVLPGP